MQGTEIQILDDENVEGKINEEDRAFMIFDHDTGKVFDTRIDKHVDTATKNASICDSSSLLVSSRKTAMKSNLGNATRASVWGNWWDDKYKVNHDFLRAAEKGNLDNLNKYLNNDMMLGKAAELNFKGHYDWTALHYAAENERVEIVLQLLKSPGIIVDPQT